jgi:hypothetical protein
MERLGPTEAPVAATLEWAWTHKDTTAGRLVQEDRVLVVLVAAAVPLTMVLLVQYQATAVMVYQTASQGVPLFVLVAVAAVHST